MRSVAAVKFKIAKNKKYKTQPNEKKKKKALKSKFLVISTRNHPATAARISAYASCWFIANCHHAKQPPHRSGHENLLLTLLEHWKTLLVLHFIHFSPHLYPKREACSRSQQQQQRTKGGRDAEHSMSIGERDEERKKNYLFSSCCNSSFLPFHHWRHPTQTSKPAATRPLL